MSLQACLSLHQFFQGDSILRSVCHEPSTGFCVLVANGSLVPCFFLIISTFFFLSEKKQMSPKLKQKILCKQNVQLCLDGSRPDSLLKVSVSCFVVSNSL